MKRSLAYNALYSVIYQLLNVLFPLISAAYLARVLLPTGVGEVDYARNILSYFVMVAGLGMSAYGTREIARCQGDQQKTNAVFSELMILCGISTTLCLVVYLIVCRVLFPENLLLHLVVGLELVFSYIGIDWLYQGTEEYGYITARNALVKFGSLVALVLFVRDGADCLAYALIHSLSVGCNNIFLVLRAGKRVKLTLTGLRIKRHLAPILWLMAGAVAAGLYTKVGVTMLGSMQGMEAVAYYTNADKLIGMAICLVTAVTAVFLPRLSYIYANERQCFACCLSDGLRIVLLLAVPSAVGIALAAENLVVCLFGAAFLPTAQTLRILAVLLVIKGTGDLLCYQAVVSSGNERDLILPRIAAGIVSILANVWLISRVAYNGAAIAFVIGELTVNGLLLPRTLSLVKIRLQAGFCGSIAAATLVMAAVVTVIQKVMGTGICSLTVSVLCGVISYGAALLATKNELLWRGMEEIKSLWENGCHPLKMGEKRETQCLIGQERALVKERDDIWKI